MALAKAVEGTGIAIATTGIGSWVGAEIGQAIQLNPHIIFPSEYIHILNDGSQAIVPTALALTIGAIVGLFASERPIDLNNDRIDGKKEAREYEAGKAERDALFRRYSSRQAMNILRQEHGLDPIPRRSKNRSSKPRL